MAGHPRLPEDFPLTPFEVQTSPPVMTEEQRRLKKRMVRRIILFCICLIPFFTWLQGTLFRQDFQLPVSSTIVIFALINVNVILILVVLFLILRYLAELIFERKMNIMGSRLRTKLVVSFLSLSLIPTILLFFVALQFISSSVDYWFSSSIEESLQESLTLARNQIQESQAQAQITGDAVARRIADYATLRPLSPKESSQYLEHRTSIAGATTFPFDTSATEALYEVSRGNLRAMDNLALRSLEITAAAERKVVCSDQVIEARARLWP